MHLDRCMYLYDRPHVPGQRVCAKSFEVFSVFVQWARTWKLTVRRSFCNVLQVAARVRRELQGSVDAAIILGLNFCIDCFKNNHS